MPKIAIIADDLTGACDAGIQLAGAGYRTSAFIDPANLPATFSGDTVAISTGSRDLDTAGAIARVRAVAGILRPAGFAHYYKKVDSLLRGSVFAEIAACMESLDCAYCLLAPAYPDNGRCLVGGDVVVTHNGGARKRIPVDLGVAARHGLRVRCIALADVAQGPQHIARIIRESILDGRVVFLADAVQNADLQAIAGAIRLAPARCLPAGSAGLARHMLAGWPRPGSPLPQVTRRPCHPGARVLVVAGSLHPASVSQVERLRQLPEYAVYDIDIAGPGEHNAPAGIHAAARALLRVADRAPSRVVITCPAANAAGDIPSKVFAQSLGRIAREVFAPLGVGALILTGGETAYHVLASLGLYAIELTEEPLEGVAAGWADGILVVTKSGGFGDSDALHTLAVYAAGQLGTSAANP